MVILLSLSCRLNRRISDFIALEKIGSEVDINLDGVIKSKECSNTNEADIISNCELPLNDFR